MKTITGGPSANRRFSVSTLPRQAFARCPSRAKASAMRFTEPKPGGLFRKPLLSVRILPEAPQEIRGGIGRAFSIRLVVDTIFCACTEEPLRMLTGFHFAFRWAYGCRKTDRRGQDDGRADGGRTYSSQSNLDFRGRPFATPRLACQPMRIQSLCRAFSCRFLSRCQYCASICLLQLRIDKILVVFQRIVGDDACIPVSKQENR